MVNIKFKSNYPINIDNIDYLSPLQKSILRSKLTDKVDNIEDFIHANIDLKYIIDLGLKHIPDMKKLNKIMDKLSISSHICIVSDFDTDGVSSAVTLEECFKLLGYTNLSTVINKRVYGTGVTDYCLDKIEEINKNQPIDLIILSDHGSANEAEYKIIKSTYKNIKIILTDHHTVSESNYPHSVDAFINPQCINHDSLLKDLSGCAVAYLTMLVIAKDRYEYLYDVMYLVGLSTISDIMPMDNIINRYFVKIGLNLLYTKWNTLLTKTLTSDKVYPKDLSFKVIPVINTGNRTNTEELSYNYLKGDEGSIASLEVLNLERKKITSDICRNIEDELRLNKPDKSICTIIDAEYSIAGNVAGKIGEQYNLPTVIFNQPNNEVITGSLRGILPMINVVQILDDINSKDNSILIRYGGHKGAGGCSIHYKKYEQFRDLFNSTVKSYLEGVDITKTVYVDVTLDDKDLHPGLMRSLDILGPFGPKWDNPVFLTKLKIVYIVPIGSISKILFKTSYGSTIEGIYHINKNNIEHLIGEKVDVVYNIEIYTHRGTSKLSLSILALKET